MNGMKKVIVINYFQLTYMIANIGVAWPQPLKILFDVEGALSTIGEHLVNPGCEFTHLRAAEVVYQKQVAYLCILPILILCAKIVWRLVACCKGKAFSHRARNGRQPSAKDSSVATVHRNIAEAIEHRAAQSRERRHTAHASHPRALWRGPRANAAQMW